MIYCLFIMVLFICSESSSLSLRSRIRCTLLIGEWSLQSNYIQILWCSWIIIILPWIFWSNASKPHIRSQCPQYIQPHEPKRKISKICTVLSIMPKSPHQFETFIQHTYLQRYKWNVTARYPLAACTICILLSCVSSYKSDVVGIMGYMTLDFIMKGFFDIYIIYIQI